MKGYIIEQHLRRDTFQTKSNAGIHSRKKKATTGYTLEKKLRGDTIQKKATKGYTI